jgi:hypothetical protein
MGGIWQTRNKIRQEVIGSSAICQHIPLTMFVDSIIDTG